MLMGDWVGFVISFIGAFVLGLLFGVTATAMYFEREEDSDDEAGKEET